MATSLLSGPTSIGNMLNTNTELDEFGNPKPKAPATDTFNLPLSQPGQPLSLTQGGQNQAPAGGVDLNAPIGTLNKMGTSGTQTDTQKMVSEATQKLLKDPNAGQNPQTNIQNQLENYDVNTAKALEAQRQKTAPVGNTGQNMYDMTDLSLKGALDRSTLQNKLQTDAATQSRANLVSALTEGRNTGAMEQGSIGQQLTALGTLTATGNEEAQRRFQAGENALDRGQQMAMQSNDQGFQKVMSDLKNKQDTGMMLTQQDFTAAQNELSRQLELAKQKNDIQAQQNITTLQAQLNLQAQKQTQDFQVKLQGLNANTQKELVQLQASVDQGKLLSEQDFTRSQTMLQNALDEARANNDTKRQISIMELQDQLQTTRDQKVQEFQSAERTATQAWETGERVSAEDATKARMYIQQQIDTAKQNNDIDAQKYLAGKQQEFEMAMQTAGFSQQDKMAYLDAQLKEAQASVDYQRTFNLENQKAVNESNLAKLQGTLSATEEAQKNALIQSNMQLDAQISEAKAGKDYQRTVDLQNLKTKSDIQTITLQQGFEAGQKALDRQLELSISNNNIDATKNLQILKMQNDATEHDKDLAIQKAQLALTQKGVDMNQWQGEYDRLSALEESGAIAPGAAMAYLQKQVSDNGVTMQAPDPLEEYKTIQAQYNSSMIQYIQTHPGSGKIDANGQASMYTDYAFDFNKYLNETIYGTDYHQPGVTATPTTSTPAPTNPFISSHRRI
jgi:hypothetical protein